MPRRALLATALLLGALAATPIGQTPVMPLADVRPGQVGVGRTVFAGTAREEFTVRILGVLGNVIGPKRSLILARLEGGPLGRTGVIAGMSGSPVYIEGRLVGAVSYALGQFATEAIAGITPIDEMVDATIAAPARHAPRPVDLRWPYDPAALLAMWARDLGGPRPFVDDAGNARVLSGEAGAIDASVGVRLRPIAVPLVAAGFDAGVLDALGPSLLAGGFVPVTAAAGPNVPGPPPTLEPGDAVGVGLLTGDFELGATGTVTHVDGDRVYAFGHPLYNLGPTEFPMTTARVQAVLPSLMQSSKLASLGPVVGTLQQDRATAVAGRLGPGPSLIPVSIVLNSRGGASRRFSFGVVRDVTFTPLLTYLAVANVLTSYERGAGPASFSVRGSASIGAEGEIAFEDIFTGEQPAGGAAAYVAGPLAALLRNTSEPVAVERVALTIDAVEQQRSARLERVWLDTPRPRPGSTVTVSVALRAVDGEEIVRRIPIDLPAEASGTLQLVVADATRTGADDRRDARGGEMQRVAQMIRTFNRARRNNRLYVRLIAAQPGVTVAGEPLAALPPSVLAVMDADRASGAVGALTQAARGEWVLALDVAVSGHRQLTLNLDQP